ncbi:MAG: class II fructose-bisphosphate aldolase [Anaerolineales bacterium]
MTLVSIKNELIKASLHGYAVPLFDVFEMQGIEGVMDALIEKRAPTIFGIYAPYAKLPNCRALSAYIRCRAEDTDVPVSIMLDHGESVAQCLQMLEYGFTDVMYDGSRLPLEENIANSRQVVEAAYRFGAGVEAELGHVGMGDDYESLGGRGYGFTDPQTVEIFVNETGVDFLAIAFGNAHGLYKGTPRLDLDLVREIRQRVKVPLVMHGGTGLSDEQFRGAIAAGISKVNFATSIMNSATENMRSAAADPTASMFSISEGIRTAYRQWCGQLYDIFDTSGKV